MDYLFYGSVTISKRMNTTIINLSIYCEYDEIINLYELSPNENQCLAYKEIATERGTDGLVTTFDVQDNQLFLFIIAGQSNEVNIPFEVTYAIYNAEVIALPENNTVHLEGTTHVFPTINKNDTKHV